jgi:polar amino acid transport system permease protein
VSTEEIISVTPPGVPQRRAVHFRGNLRAAIAAAVASIAVAVFALAMLWSFDQSLHVDASRQVIARIFEVVLGVAALVVPYYGVRAVMASLRGEHLAENAAYQDARVAVEDSRDHIWVVVGLGLTAFVIAFGFFLLSANQGAVRSVLFDWSIIWKSRTGLIKGFWLNIKLFAVSEILVLIWALLVAVVRQLPGRACAPVRFLAIAYTDVFRGVPAVITIYLIVFGFALAGVPVFDSMSKNGQVFWLSVLALVLVYGAYVAEVYRAGLESVHWSQSAAARSLGLSQWQTFRFVVIPQAVRRIVPPLLNDFVALQKDTALVAFVGVVEILNYATLYKNQYFNLSPVTGAAIAYLIITIPVTRFVDYLIRIDKERTQAR